MVTGGEYVYRCAPPESVTRARLTGGLARSKAIREPASVKVNRTRNSGVTQSPSFGGTLAWALSAGQTSGA
jgi:hypothetical protein